MAALQAIVCLLAAAALACGVRAATPPVCDYNCALTPWYGCCDVSPDWLMTRKGHSPLAKFDLALNRATAKCAAHDVSSGTAAQFAACNADEANSCYAASGAGPGYIAMEDFGWSCLSWGVKAKKALGLCPGAPYTQIMNCSLLTHKHCTGGCKWSPNTLYLEMSWFDTNTANHSGLLDKYGLCVPTWANTSSYIAYNTWYNAAAQTPEFYGNCSSYGATVIAARQYAQTCRSANVVDSQGYNLGFLNAGTVVTYGENGPIFSNVTGYNATGIQKCLWANCHISARPWLDADPNTFTVDNLPYCTVDQGVLQHLRYPDHRDHGLVDAYQLCSGNTVQWNQSVCNGAEL